MWVVFLDADGACWTVPNPEICMASNWSFGRRPDAKTVRDAGNHQASSIIRLYATVNLRMVL